MGGATDDQRAKILVDPNEISGGVELSKPVEVIQFPLPETVAQYTRSHGFPGNWFDSLGNQAPDTLGLNGISREKKVFMMPQGSGLKNYAKPVVDNWTVPEFPVATNGGGVKVFVTDEVKSAVGFLGKRGGYEFRVEKCFWLFTERA